MPRISGLCLSERVLQPTRFGEIERPTTNQTLSLLRSQPEDLACQTPKYESDVFLSQPAPAPLQTGIFPGPSRNRGSIVQANRVGMKGKKSPCRKPKKQARRKNIPRLDKWGLSVRKMQAETITSSKNVSTSASFMPAEEVA
ncbi:hypothetical protein CFBP6625_15395 [Agrobacterium tumefaciens]|nr:hypothetical protein CFBP6625_15395 [Agrobacterium tumefaciens]